MQHQITFQNNNKQNLAGILSVPNKTSKDIAIISHGFASTKDRTKYRQLQDALDAVKIHSLSIDLWGHGESDGSISDITVEKGTESIEAAIEFTRKQGFQNTHLIGFSFGGYCSVIAANQNKIKSLTLISPVIDYPHSWAEELGQEGMYKWKEKGYRMRTNSTGTTSKINYSLYESTLKYDLFKTAKETNIPVRIIQGDVDKDIPIDDVVEVSKTFPNAELIMIKGAGHKYGEHMGEMIKKVIKFLTIQI